MKGKQMTPNNLLKKLYGYTKNKEVHVLIYAFQKAFKRIIPVHKHVFLAIQHGQLLIEQKKQPIEEQLAQYKYESRLIMDEQIMSQCISIYNLYEGKQKELQKYNSKQRKLLKQKEERQLNKQQSSKSLLQKQNQYQGKVKQWRKYKEKIQEIKKIQKINKNNAIQEEQQKIQKEKEKQLEKQKEERKLKVQLGLKQIQQRRKKRQEMVKQLSKQRIHSQSMKHIGRNSQPLYIQLEKKYLQRERQKMEEAKQLQRQKRQSMQIKIDEINQNQRQYLQKIKQNFTRRGHDKKQDQIQVHSRKVKSDFNVISSKNEEDQVKYRSKAIRRKQFESVLRNIPIHIDPTKKKQKEIQVDKMVNKQKYMLLAKRHIQDDKIFNEFKDFQVKINPRQLGKNYLNELKNIPKQNSQHFKKRHSHSLLSKQPVKFQYINYLQQLRSKQQYKKRSSPAIQQKDELLKLVEKSKRILKKSHFQQQNQEHASYRYQSLSDRKQSRLKESRNQPPPQKIRQSELKAEVAKSITEKINQYERQVLKKVKDLKKISEYDDTLKQQNDIDDLYTKLLKAKLDTIEMS